MKIKNVISFLIFISIFFVILSCAKKDDKNTLVVISPHWEGMRVEYTSAFKDWYKKNFNENVEVEWIDQGGTSDDIAYIKSEFSRKPDGIKIDIFFGGGLEPFLNLSKNNLLLQYKVSDSVLSKIPQNLAGTPIYDKDYYWYGVQLAGFGILYNKVLMSGRRIEFPKTWKDLARPSLLGLVGSADPRHSGTMHMMYEIMLQAYGWDLGFEIIKKMAGNIKIFSTSASQLAKDITSGNILCGLCLDSYAWAQIAEVGADKVGFVFPEGLSIINPDSIAILKGAPHLVLSQRFVEFVLSEEGQKLLMLNKGEPEGPKQYALAKMSVIPDLYNKLGKKCVVPSNPFKFKTTFKYDEQKGATRYGILNDLLGALVIDTHKELVSKWSDIIKKGMRKEDLSNLSKMPVSENELLELTKEKWGKSDFRNEKITEWVIFAQGCYKIK